MKSQGRAIDSVGWRLQGLRLLSLLLVGSVFQACSTDESPESAERAADTATPVVATDAAALDAGSVMSRVVENPTLSWVEFEARFNEETGGLDFTFGSEGQLVQTVDGLVTRDMPLWCNNRLAIDADGIPYRSLEPELELYTPNSSIAFGDDCATGEEQVSYDDPDFGQGAFCAQVEARNFYRAPIEMLYAEIEVVRPPENRAYNWADFVDYGFGTGVRPPDGDRNAEGDIIDHRPTDINGGLFYFGDVAPMPADFNRDTDVGGVKDAVVSSTWIFRQPTPIDGNFYFRGRFVAAFRELDNNQDDDCDGLIDEGLGEYVEGTPCVNDSDCASGICDETTNTCGGILLPEVCDNTVDDNGNGFIDCEDPTCSGVGSCINFDCADGNLGSRLSVFELGESDFGVVEGTIEFGERSQVTLASRQCLSFFAGGEDVWLWTPPHSGSYTFTIESVDMDVALALVPVSACDLSFAANPVAAGFLCADIPAGLGVERFTRTANAGQLYMVIVDSANPSTAPLSYGDYTLYIEKEEFCGDGYLDRYSDLLGNPAETCDDAGDSANCDVDCTPRECGDSYINTAVETCEDGNTNPGDGCTASCTTERGYLCLAVDAPCITSCGDGIVAGLEGCDDGNRGDGDGCDTVCVLEPGFICPTEGTPCQTVCGDGFVRGAEQCDDDDTDPLDGCGATCLIEDGYLCDGADPTVCTDINECLGNPCGLNATCTNLPGTFNCACNAGFTGNGITCSNIDECATNTDNCSDNATCTDTTGFFTCACNPGYSGNGVTCTDINECTTSVPALQDLCADGRSCINNDGGYTCGDCPDGFEENGLYSCGILNCPEPGLPGVNGDRSGNYSFESVVTYTCNTGYYLSTLDTTLQCVFNAVSGQVEWDGPTPVCEEQSCPAVSATAPLGVSSVDRTYQGQANYSCASGYLPPSPVTQLTCGAGVSIITPTGQWRTGATTTGPVWNSTAPTCAPVTCALADRPAIGVSNSLYGNYSLVSNGVGGLNNSAGAQYQVNCQNGYTRNGGATLTCSGAGTWQWDTSAASCVNIDECAGTNQCGAFTDCADRSPDTQGGVDYVCTCRTGYNGTPRNGNCAPTCGDSRLVTGEACDCTSSTSQTACATRNSNGNAAPACEQASCSYCTATCGTASVGVNACGDGIDNDVQQGTDCSDPDCYDQAGCLNPNACGQSLNGGVRDVTGNTGWFNLRMTNNDHDTDNDDINDGAFLLRPPANRQYRAYRFESDCYSGGYFGSGVDVQVQVDYTDRRCSGRVSGPYNSDINSGFPVFDNGDWDVRLDWTVDGGFQTVVLDQDGNTCGIFGIGNAQSDCSNNRDCSVRVSDLGSCGSGFRTDHNGVCQPNSAVQNGTCDDGATVYNVSGMTGRLGADFWNGTGAYPGEVCDCTASNDYSGATSRCGGETFNGYINYRETGFNQTGRNESRCGCQTCGRSCTGPSWARVCTPRSCTLFGCETANNCTYFVVQNQYRTPTWRDNCGCGRIRVGSEERYGP